VIGISGLKGGVAGNEYLLHLTDSTGAWNTVVDLFDFCFAENGLTAIRLGENLPSNSFIKWLGEEKYKKLANFILHYIADLDIPVKRYDTPHLSNAEARFSLWAVGSLIQELIF